MKTHKRPIKAGEALAIMPESVHAERGAFWFLFGAPTPMNERIGETAVVHIRGSLDHHAGWGDSYQAILARIADAISGDDVVRAATRKKQEAQWYGADGEAELIQIPDPSPPKSLILRIDSPGGVVGGLNEAVFAIRKMKKKTGIPMFAYVDELCASAAYALACACDKIYGPPSCVAGSIGVISQMLDVTAADEKAGAKFITITSGARKADGNPHVPMTDAAASAEQQRVDMLARQFYKLVSQARPLGTKEIESLQAGIYIGEKAKAVGLIDGVMSWDEMVESVDHASKNIDEPGSENATSPQPKKDSNMNLAIQRMIDRTKAALAGEKDSEKRKALQAQLSAFQTTAESFKKEKFTKETHEKEECEDEGDEADAEGEEADTSAESDDDEGDGGDDESDDGDESAEKAEAAIAKLAYEATGKKGKKAVGALAAMISAGAQASKRLAVLEKERSAEKKATAIADAKRARRITPHEAKTLTGKSYGFVKSYLEMRPNAIVNGDDEEGVQPGGAAANGKLSADTMKQIEFAMLSVPEGQRAKVREQMVAEHEKRLAASANGAGRY